MERKELIDVVVQLWSIDTMIQKVLQLTTRKVLPPFGTCAHSSLGGGGQYSPVNNVQGDIIHSNNSRASELCVCTHIGYQALFPSTTWPGYDANVHITHW